MHYDRSMRLRAFRLAALLASALAVACGGLEPASFEVVDIERARAILRDGDVEVVLTDAGGIDTPGAGSDTDGGGPSGAQPVSPGALGPAPSGDAVTGAAASGAREPDQTREPAETRGRGEEGAGVRDAARAGRVLVVAAAPELGYRSAAALARSGRSPVVLVIASRDEDRRSLVALTQQRTEATIDEQDS
jgi:hypothetical protein